MGRSTAMATTVDGILEEIAQLSIEDQEMVDEIMRKRIIEGKRDEIRVDYLAALEDRAQGRIQSGSVSDLFGSL
ncbi:MAG: hypothetical protein ACLQMF_07460 [Rectinemataceae bacterium]